MEYSKKHKMLCLNKECNNIWHTKPSTILGKKTGCPKCNKLQSYKKQKGKDRFHETMKQFKNFKLLGSYVLSTHKVKIECLECGNILMVTPKEIYRRSLKCKCKTQSRYTLRIRKYLDENNINYISEYTGDKILSPKNKLLKYDFYLKDLSILLEIDGEQHFDKTKFDGKYYKEQIINDTIKNKLSKKTLVRISYSEFSNFEKILNWIVLNSTTIEKKTVFFGVEYISSDMETEDNLIIRVEDMVLYPIEI